MIDAEKFLRGLLARELEFYTGVPDSLLKDFCACVQKSQSASKHVIAANEGGAIGLAVGYHLATGKTPFVYLQNSGLGNTVNPVLSLASPEVYGIPMLILVGWRGAPGVPDEPQHVHQGRVMLDSLDSMDLPYFTLECELSAALETIEEAKAVAESKSTPVFLAAKKGLFSKYNYSSPESNYSLTREEAIQTAIKNIPEDSIFVSTTGMPSRELYEHRVTTKAGHSRDFLTVGGMGHANQIALGLSLSDPEKSICCIDGDGALLMHMGGLAISGTLSGARYTHLLFNNGVHDSVGGQPTVGLNVDLCAVAKACGYGFVRSVSTESDLIRVLEDRQHSATSAFIEIKIRPGARGDVGRPKERPSENKAALMKALGSSK